MRFALLKVCCTSLLLLSLTGGMCCAQTQDSEPRFDRSMANVMPLAVYPLESRRLKERGQVLVNVLVLSDGSIGDAHVLKSSGFERLDEAALEWYKHHGKYLPAVKDGKPIDAWKVITVNFQ